MRALIFAGGSGRRLWPISRQASPKQFEPIIGEESTLQMAISRVLPTYGADSIYVATNSNYLEMVQDQLPQIDPTHLIGEPTRRDLGPAVGLAMAHVAQENEDEPVAILWSDNVIENVGSFLHLMSTAESLVLETDAELVYLGETPRFANENLGWIRISDQLGTHDGEPYFRFESLTYRPSLEKCRAMFESGDYVWNTGFFVTRPRFIRSLYRQYMPEMWEQLSEIEASIGTDNYETVLNDVYPKMESISFDDAILAHMEPGQALVLHSDMGWSDPGTLYALKETVAPDPEINATKGLVIDASCRDSLIYNYEPEKLVMTIGLDGVIVVNTEDALLVAHKDSIPQLKEEVNKLEGTELEKYS
ncbi:MAG: sugar phosphate nucleotidyltransferase [Chloroflexota bacterium]